MDADGSNNLPLINTNPYYSSSLSWSPDGAKIAFDLLGNIQGDIHAINSDGSGRVNLTNNPANDYKPSWGTVPNRAAFDFDGDGKSDISVFRPNNGVWHLSRSTQGFSATQFGLSSDKITPADFDGDGKTDIAVFRNGTWYLQRSQSGFTAVQFGQAGDIPVPADYDGDGRADVAVFRNGIWIFCKVQTIMCAPCSSASLRTNSFQMITMVTGKPILQFIETAFGIGLARLYPF
jgi:hypothetical protein